ncbi:protein-L-isoaspartate(D-aspartate) O-methyltransferase [Sulfidibacter corallicola]|uniref:Protein-L-isoaspartate O-methyltransferase n=1 Tax=Sulfidibacter corallicola TaxID=2818388 RepID=A0A8A4TJ30_SULCO|nr:protein-L-isoaspartate(D-aspartate) O-methyltransferase [Sulfidibacter corallicola]QTD49204.1 protein-L-isoaspartate(D-aspartate) O-methyltransferase [Sulfidibacter corallicola]
MTLATKIMVESQIKSRGVVDPLVLAAMERVPRVEFVLEEYKQFAHADCPLPIEAGQTISQPYMVAAMTEMLQLGPESRVLEIGTGCGYQSAVLAEIVSHLYTVEIVPTLAQSAKSTLTRLGYRNISFKEGDGYYGWAENAPFDGIIVTAAPTEVPAPLIAQLQVGGKMIIPVGPNSGIQYLHTIEKLEDGGIRRTNAMAVRFVPLTGDH